MSDINEALNLISDEPSLTPSINRVIYYDFPTSYVGNSVLDPGSDSWDAYGDVSEWSSVQGSGFQAPAKPLGGRMIAQKHAFHYADGA